jgi:23S rRNA (cytosine1962-C5)-methyltransferase
VQVKKAYLKPGKEYSILRGHPWIFSGAIAEADECQVGDWVEVYDNKKNFLAAGHAGNGSIAIRVLTREEESPNQDFWLRKLQNCRNLRLALGFDFNTPTNAYRLVHGEGDLLPGLIIDIYGTCAVIQAHSHGMYFSLQDIATALQTVMKGNLSTIYSKSKASLHDDQADDGWLLGEESETVASENGILFKQGSFWIKEKTESFWEAWLLAKRY